jgi:hypothetical protein
VHTGSKGRNGNGNGEGGGQGQGLMVVSLKQHTNESPTFRQEHEEMVVGNPTHTSCSFPASLSLFLPFSLTTLLSSPNQILCSIFSFYASIPTTA